MNDCNYWVTDRGGPRVSAKAFAANLEEIVERGRRFGARKVFLLTNHPSGRNSAMPERDFSYESSNKRYNEIIRQVASGLRDSAELIDLEKAFEAHMSAKGSGVASLLLADLVHLGPGGHEIYFETVWPAFRDAVNDVLAPGRAGALERG
jgi:lysophospholipase L1-like esterase